MPHTCFLTSAGWLNRARLDLRSARGRGSACIFRAPLLLSIGQIISNGHGHQISKDVNCWGRTATYPFASSGFVRFDQRRPFVSRSTAATTEHPLLNSYKTPLSEIEYFEVLVKEGRVTSQDAYGHLAQNNSLLPRSILPQIPRTLMAASFCLSSERRQGGTTSKEQIRNLSYRFRSSRLEQYPPSDGSSHSVENIDDFRCLTQKGEATFKDAYHLLSKQRKEIELMPSRKRLDAASRAGAGDVLLWIKHSKLLNFDQHFAYILCWFLHAEKLDDFIVDWLVAATQDEAKVPYYRNVSDRSKWTWARHLYSGILMARHDWAPHGNANSALKKFRGDLAGHGTKHVLQVIGIAGALSTMQRRLFHDWEQPCRSDLYGWLHNLDVRISPRKMHAMLNAVYPLFHPNNANPDAMLDYVRRGEPSGIVVPHLPERIRAFWAEKHLFRTAFLLRLQGHKPDADWIEEYVQTHFPTVCERRHQWYYFTARDPKLQHVLHGKLDEPWIPKLFTQSGVSSNPPLHKKSWHNLSRTMEENTNFGVENRPANGH